MQATKSTKQIPMAQLVLPPPLLNKYLIRSQLGKGASGSVFEAIDICSGRLVAIKFMFRSKVPPSRLAIEKFPNGSMVAVPMEVYILRRLKHPNIIELLDYACDEDYFYIVTELHGTSWRTQDFFQNSIRAKTEVGVSSQAWHLKSSTMTSLVTSQKQFSAATDLFECLEMNGALAEPIVLHIFRQLSDVLAYLKHMNCYHLDIKDENIVVDTSFRIKLIDFGSAHILPPSSPPLVHFFGTIEYAPPELLSEGSYSAEKVDIWASGVLMFMLLYGQPPFQSSKHMIAGHFAPLKYPKLISQETTRLLQSLLEYDSLKRITMDEFRARLHHF